MWSRAELKNRAKDCLRKYYWAALAVTFLVGILGGGGGSSVGSSGASMGQSFSQAKEQAQYSGGGLSSSDMAVLAGVVTIIFAVAMIFVVIGALFRIFVGNVMTVGGNRYFMESRAVGRSAGVGKIFYGFGCGSYLNVVKTQFLKDLFVFLWTLLLIVPGVIKAYQYYMVPYILSENPDMGYRDALDLSRQMMDGHKLDTFVLELSFFGWYLLGALCCGIGVIFVEPYVQATMAELYAVLRGNVGAVNLRGFGGEDQYYDNVVSEQ